MLNVLNTEEKIHLANKTHALNCVQSAEYFDTNLIADDFRFELNK